MRVALAQVDPTVGTLDANADLLALAGQRARGQGADLVVFPELALTGYPPRDLLDRPSFARDAERVLRELAADLPHGPTYLVGLPTRRSASTGRALHNSVAVIRHGAVERFVHKRLLPTYDVFDESRWFEPGTEVGLIEVTGTRVGVTVCEDAWTTVNPLGGRRYAVDPVLEAVGAGAEVIVNVGASPFTRDKLDGRAALFSGLARRIGRPVVMVNQVGAHDDLVFDGQSGIWGPDGMPWARAAAFGEDLITAEVIPGGPRRDRPATEEAAVLDALALGVRSYVRKTGFADVLVGLSGGIDSALTAAIAARALGAEHVHGLALPSRYSSDHSLEDARALADNLGMPFGVVAIEPVFAAYRDVLGPALAALGDPPPGDVTYENVQSRIRCAILMAHANRAHALLLNTGNKSEVAVGYSTLYGDMAGALAVIADLPKTFVYRLAREVNRQAGRPVIPERTLTKPPSAELRPDQQDADTLPPYEVLDPILERLIERQGSIDDVVGDGFDRVTVERVAHLIRVSEHKRRQLPPALVVSGKAFSYGRRMPLAQGYRS
ncbi:MAG: NAD+ synthase [Sandaracinaceae bacterium]